MKKNLFAMAVVVCAAGLALFVPQSASAGSLTISGSALLGLTYVSTYPNTGDAQYFSGIPPVAQLYTADAGTALTADSPAVFAQGPFGTLNAFSASFDLYSSSGGGGNPPYWNLVVSPTGDPSATVNIIAFGGSLLDGSSQIHAYNADYSSAVGSFGMTLSALDALTYDGYMIGDMTVDWAGIEIGDWAISDSITASAEFSSITLNSASAVPDHASTAWLLAGSFGLLVLIARRKGIRSAIGS